MKVNNSSFMAKVFDYSARALGTVTDLRPVKWVGDQFQKNPEKALALTTVGSIVIKDGVGCYKYVTQSLNNKEIPDERRNFVAALDLSNGILMILAQIGMFFAMRKFSEPIFNKCFKKSFSPETLENIAAKLRMEDIANGKHLRKLCFDKDAAKLRKDALDLFKFVADIAAATIVGKRIIVPFIATPVANVIKGKMDQKTQAEKGDDAEEEKVTTEIEKTEKTEEVKETKKAVEVEDDDDDHDDD